MKEKHLEFEGTVERLGVQIGELEKLSSAKGIDYSVEIRVLGKKRARELKTIYENLSAWQTVQVARHENRPVLVDYLEHMVKDFRELHGDRCFGDDRAIICGLGEIGKYKIMVVAHNKRGINLSLGDDEVINNELDLIEPIVKLKPLGVIKG